MLKTNIIKSEQPIGIFDSGVGGLTVARAIHKQLPQESIIYFGDTAHSPWGSQSASAISHYASRISETLLQQNCKAIVIACNSASASAFEAIKDTVQDRALLFNVIDPVVEHVTNNYKNKTIGLIGTKQTIKSSAYLNRINTKTNSIDLRSLASPMLVPLIEEGFSNTSTASEIIKHYLSNPYLEGIAALILGCTHYPLIKQQVSDFFKQQIEIIDSAQLIAHVLEKSLQEKQLQNLTKKPEMTFYVSHDSEFFNQTAQQFFPGNIKLETYPLWG